MLEVERQLGHSRKGFDLELSTSCRIPAVPASVSKRMGMIRSLFPTFKKAFLNVRLASLAPSTGLPVAAVSLHVFIAKATLQACMKHRERSKFVPLSALCSYFQQ